MEITDPFRTLGTDTIQPLQQFVQSGQDAQTVAQINPLLDFYRNQGFGKITGSAAAKGILGEGTLKDLVDYDTQLSSTIVPQLQQQRFNQLYDLVRLGGNVATGQGTTAVNTASNIGNLFTGKAGAEGGAVMNAANSRTRGAGNLLNLATAAAGAAAGVPLPGGSQPVSGSMSTVYQPQPSVMQYFQPG